MPKVMASLRSIFSIANF